jgi:hypothetical protein
MRKQIILLGGLLVLAAAILVIASNTMADGAQSYETEVHVHASQNPATPVVSGANARLVTNENGATMTIHTNSLTPGNAVTLWVVVINNPAACATSPCTAADILFNTTAVEAQVTYGAGHIVGGSGQVTLSSHLQVGPVPGGWYAGQEFTDPTMAEVHLVLNDHGPKLPAYMPDMIRTYRGGCTDESLPPPFPASAKADGTPGPNTCRLVQFAIFQQE